MIEIRATSSPVKGATAVCIYGAGGHAVDLLTQLSFDARRFDIKCMVDDFRPDRQLLGYTVMTFDQALSQNPDAPWLVAVGDCLNRKRIFERIESHNRRIISFVSSLAHVGRVGELGPGVQIFSGCYLSDNVRLGKGVVMNANSSVSHDCVIGDFSTLSPACILGGRVCVENEVFIGLGAKITHRKLGQPLTVGKNAVVGVGAVVIDDVESGATVVGVPAVSIR